MKYLIALALYIAGMVLALSFGMGWFQSMGVVLLASIAGKVESIAVNDGKKRKEAA